MTRFQIAYTRSSRNGMGLAGRVVEGDVRVGQAFTQCYHYTYIPRSDVDDEGAEIRTNLRSVRLIVTGISAYRTELERLPSGWTGLVTVEGELVGLGEDDVLVGG